MSKSLGKTAIYMLLGEKKLLRGAMDSTGRITVIGDKVKAKYKGDKELSNMVDELIQIHKGRGLT